MNEERLMLEFEEKFFGFKPETLDYLRALDRNNNKKWFEKHRKEYETNLLIPFKNLVNDLGGFMLTIDPYLEIKPAVTKTVSRIYRDTRFSKDKTPYRPRMWLVFKRPNKEWQDAPGFYFQLSPDHYSFGMGYYDAKRATMDKFREAIDNDHDAFLRIVSFRRTNPELVLQGDEYKRIFDKSKPPEIQEWYQKKSFHLGTRMELSDTLYGRALVDELLINFGYVSKLYHFLWKIRGDVLPE